MRIREALEDRVMTTLRQSAWTWVESDVSASTAVERGQTYLRR